MESSVNDDVQISYNGFMCVWNLIRHIINQNEVGAMLHSSWCLQTFSKSGFTLFEQDIYKDIPAWWHMYCTIATVQLCFSPVVCWNQDTVNKHFSWWDTVSHATMARATNASSERTNASSTPAIALYSAWCSTVVWRLLITLPLTGDTEWEEMEEQQAQLAKSYSLRTSETSTWEKCSSY